MHVSVYLCVCVCVVCVYLFVCISKVKSLSRVQLFATLWAVAHQAPPSMEVSRQVDGSGLPFPSPGDLPDPGMEPRSPALQADALFSEPPGKPLCIYLYVFLRVCVFVCMCLCVCIFVYICVCMYIFVCISVCVCTRVHVYLTSSTPLGPTGGGDPTTQSGVTGDSEGQGF